MTSRERLMATLQGEPVDRPAVSFYEIGGFKIDPTNNDPFNVYNSPDWQPLLSLAEKETDLIRMRPPTMIYPSQARRTKEADGKAGKSDDATLPSILSVDPESDLVATESYMEHGSRFVRSKINIAGRTLTSLTRRNPDVDTIWTLARLCPFHRSARVNEINAVTDFWHVTIESRHLKTIVRSIRARCPRAGSWQSKMDKV